VTDIEKQAQQIERGQLAEPGRLLLVLLEELARLKTEALDRFTAGELGGKELLVGFLAHVAEVRAHLVGLTAQHGAPGEETVGYSSTPRPLAQK
jgi:hypothetical protein